MAIVRHIHVAGTELTPEQIARIRSAAKIPYTYDPDCPLLTEEQLAEFKPVHFATWEERDAHIREKMATDPEFAAWMEAERKEVDEAMDADPRYVRVTAPSMEVDFKR